MPPPFPQAHRAKNLASSGGKGTKTGDMVLHIQKALPNARVMYVSATRDTAEIVEVASPNPTPSPTLGTSPPRRLRT